LLVVGAAAVCLAASIAAPAAGAREVVVEARLSGVVSVVWQGSVERGCAAGGTCGMTGSTSYRPGDLVIELNEDGSSSAGGYGDLPSSTVRVRQEMPSGSPATCVDLLPDGFPLAGISLFDGRLEVGFAEQELSAGRCAGPRPIDLLRALPHKSLSLRSIRGRTRVVDMSGRFPYVAGSFAGHVISSVRLTVRRRSPRRGDGSGRIVSRRDRQLPVSPRRRYAVLTLTYRAGPSAGTLLTSFRGRVEPACVALGACGVRGTSAYEFATRGTEVAIHAWRPQRRGRARRGELLRALRRGALPIEADAKLLSASSRVRQAVGLPGAPECGDSGFVEPPELMLRRQATARRLSVLLRPSDLSTYADTLRARCPGPAQDDVLPGYVLARGHVELSALGASALPVKLGSTAPAFLSEGYSGERSGELPLDLRLSRVHVGIERFR
jgi:hypothetical protein